MNKMLLELPEKIFTKRLEMRPYKPGDGQEYFSVIENNKEHLWEAANDRLLSFAKIEDAEVYIRELAANWVARERFVLGAREKDHGEYVAEIWIEPDDWENGIFEIGWFVTEAHQGHGYVTEAARRSLQFIFEELQAHKVIVTTDDTNRRSNRVAERCGFVQEGCLREKNKSKKGNWTNTLYYGMLKDEYEKLKREGV